MPSVWRLGPILSPAFGHLWSSVARRLLSPCSWDGLHFIGRVCAGGDFGHTGGDVRIGRLCTTSLPCVWALTEVVRDRGYYFCNVHRDDMLMRPRAGCAARSLVDLESEGPSLFCDYLYRFRACCSPLPLKNASRVSQARGSQKILHGRGSKVSPFRLADFQCPMMKGIA